MRLEVDAHDADGDARPAAARSSSSDQPTSTWSTSPLDLSGLCPADEPRPAGPEGRALDAGRRRAGCSRRSPDGRTSSRAPRRATCWSTTPTTRSTRRSRRSSTRRPRDPHVLAIKQTLYRTSATTARSCASLVRAAEAGKQVVALVELKARFDEEANIDVGARARAGGRPRRVRRRRPEDAREDLAGGPREGDGIRRYCHVGTGNYNPDTARLYEDLGPADGRRRSWPPTSPTCSTT